MPSGATKLARWADCIQLPTTNLSAVELQKYTGRLPELSPSQLSTLNSQLPPSRRLPSLTLLAALEAPDLASRSVAMPQANTLAHINYLQRRFGRLQSPSGQISLFNPEFVLVKFRQQSMLSLLRVESGRELAAVQRLAARADVEFAELDQLE
ncbi:MAG TPA: hypothetical protein VNT26_02465, partial [Candidatus Sulfotelmatobacter sp.]|nr:hypothetical protein [Candidatus Sulfotelmatobacter sp.]